MVLFKSRRVAPRDQNHLGKTVSILTYYRNLRYNSYVEDYVKGDLVDT